MPHPSEIGRLATLRAKIMGYHFRQHPDLHVPVQPQPSRPWKWFYVMLFVAFLAGLVGALTPAERYDGSRIAGGSFPWPEGCQPRDYRSSNRLPKACFDRFQKISYDWIVAHGLKLDSRRRGKTTYYRLGNDAVNPLCAAWEESCTIKVSYTALFVVDSKVAGTTSADWRTLPLGEEP